MADDSTRLVAGCMTGTSIDGLDAALVEIRGRGLAMQARVIRCLSRPLEDLAAPLRRLAEQHPMTAGEIAALSRAFALAHADALCELAAGERLELACIHGQTVFHSPPLSWQLLNPAPIARALSASIVYDLRAADLAAGGQGAPITPLADWVLFSAPDAERVIVNLGGFANFTRLPDGNRGELGGSDGIARITGGDICACNQVLDMIARERLGSRYDDGGRAAMAGRAEPGAGEGLRALLRAQAGAGRSLGTGDELSEWIEVTRALRANDVARTACEAIADIVVEKCGPTPCVILAGGGVHNDALVAAIRERSVAPVVLSDTFGVSTAYREAACFAVLGALCQDRVPITLSQVTGVPAPAPIAGAWVYP